MDHGKRNMTIELELEVHHGRPARRDKRKVTLPEFIRIVNSGKRSVNLGRWYLTDYTETPWKGRWAGEGLVKFPPRAVLKAGSSFVVENIPYLTVFQSLYGYSLLSYREAYGTNPDYVILPKGQKTTSLKQLIHVKGALRLKGFSAWEESERGVSKYDMVWLIRKSKLSDKAVANHLEKGTLPEDLIAVKGSG